MTSLAAGVLLYLVFAVITARLMKWSNSEPGTTDDFFIVIGIIWPLFWLFAAAYLFFEYVFPILLVPIAAGWRAARTFVFREIE